MAARPGRPRLLLTCALPVLLAALSTIAQSTFGQTNPPTILVQPRGGAAVAGDYFAFDVLPGGTGPFAYQWWKTPSTGAEVSVPGATGIVFKLLNLQAGDAGQYRVVVTNSFGSVTSSFAGLTVSDPIIRIQPQGATVSAGTNGYTFTVDARGTPPLHYQWETNSVPVVAQTSNSMVLPILTKANEASYRVVVTNALGSITSASVPLTVIDPVILKQPEANTFNQGDTVTLSVTASGTIPLGYQWLYQGVPVTNGTTQLSQLFTNDVLEMSTSSLTLTNVTTAQSGGYAVRVTNSKGTVTSITTNLVVYSLAILQQPTNAAVSAGQNVTNEVKAAGTPPLAYQWHFRPATNAVTNALPSQTNRVLILTNVSGTGRGSYWAEVSNSAGSSNSTQAALTVTDPIITTQPQGGAVEVGGSFCFNVDAKSQPLSYQWLHNGVALPGATNASLCLSNVVQGQSGSYSVTLSNAFGMVTSVAAGLAVDDLTILAQPHSGWRAAGESNQFSVTVRGTQPLTYQWYFEGAMLPGQNASNLLLASVSSSNMGTYWVTVTNGVGRGVRSANAILTVFDPVIRQQPVGGEPAPGSNFTFLAEAGGTSPFSYQWFFNGNPLGSPVLNAGPSNSLTLTNLGYTQSGAYTVLATNSSGGVLSAEALLTVNDPFIQTQPQPGDVDAGKNFTNTVAALGTAPLTYQWFRNSAAVAGATNSTLILTNVTASQAGTYFVEISNPLGTRRTDSAMLTVQDPAIREQPRGGNVAVGEDFTFKATATGTQPIIYQWYFNGALLPGKVGDTLVLSDLLSSQAGQYSVVVRNAAGSRSSSNAVLTLSTTAPRTLYNGAFTFTATEAQCDILLQGNGTENAVQFSLGYDPAVLMSPVFTPAPSGTLCSNVSLPGGRLGFCVQRPAGSTYPAYAPQTIGTLRFSVVGTNNPLNGQLRFTNAPVSLAASDTQGGLMDLRSSLIPAFTVLDPQPQFHPQSGLFVQRARLSNPTSIDSTQAVVYVGGLGKDSLSNAVTFANAHTGNYLSDPDGNGVSDTITRAAQVELLRGQTLDVTLEFYVSDRTTVPQYESYGSYFGSLGLQPPYGGSAIPVRSARYVNNEFLVEFLTEANASYYVQYADSLAALANPASLKTAFPAVAGTGSNVQWIDNGPPKTTRLPTNGMRFYKVIKSP